MGEGSLLASNFAAEGVRTTDRRGVGRMDGNNTGQGFLRSSPTRGAGGPSVPANEEHMRDCRDFLGWRVIDLEAHISEGVRGPGEGVAHKERRGCRRGVTNSVAAACASSFISSPRTASSDM